MFDIIAGHDSVYQGTYVDETELSELPEHMQVLTPTAEDEATYAETDMSDAELLALAAEDAADAHTNGELGGPALDEVSLRRAARRAHRADQRQALRTTAIGGVA